MQPLNVEQWNKTFNHIQEPVQEIAELNIKTLKKFSYLKPEELTRLQKPEDVIAKNIDIFIKNGRETLNYMQRAFNICEKHFISLSDDVRETTELAINQTKSALRDSIKKNTGL